MFVMLDGEWQWNELPGGCRQAVCTQESGMDIRYGMVINDQGQFDYSSDADLILYIMLLTAASSILARTAVRQRLGPVRFQLGRQTLWNFKRYYWKSEINYNFGVEACQVFYLDSPSYVIATTTHLHLYTYILLYIYD